MPVNNPLKTPVSLPQGGTNADLSGTGGASQVLKQVSVGAAVTVAQLAASDLSNGVQGSGAVVLVTSPTITTPTITTPTITGQAAVTGDVNLTQLASPSAPASVTTAGSAGTTHITYGYSAVDANGFETPVSNTTAFLTANATLDGTNYTIITAPALPTGAISMKLYRTATDGSVPTTVGVIATGLAGGAVTNDQALAGTKFFGSAVAPGTNQTAGIIIPGRSGNTAGAITPDVYTSREDFTAMMFAASGTANSEVRSETEWGVGRVGTTTTWSWSHPANVLPNIGVITLTQTTSIAQSDGTALWQSLNPIGDALGIITTRTFDSYFVFKLGQTTSTRFRIGFAVAGDQSSLPTSITWFGLRYDTGTNFTDTDFIFETVGAHGSSQSASSDSLIAADTNWHTLRLRSTVAGTLLFSLDGGTEASLATHVQTASSMTPFMQITTDTTAAKSASWDFYSIYMNGLAR